LSVVSGIYLIHFACWHWQLGIPLHSQVSFTQSLIVLSLPSSQAEFLYKQEQSSIVANSLKLQALLSVQPAFGSGSQAQFTEFQISISPCVQYRLQSTALGLML